MSCPQRSKSLSAACLAATLGLARTASAAEDWLTWAPSARCAIDRDELALRILSAALGKPNRELSVDVQLADAARGTLAVVQLRLGPEVMGTKRLVAPVCEEVLDAVVAVVALALSTEGAGGRSSSVEPLQGANGARLPRARVDEPRGVRRSAAAPPPSVTAPPPSATAPPPSATAPPAADLGPSVVDPVWGASGFRVLVAGGVDTGTLDELTAVAGAGVALNLGRGELRAIAWYGLPSYRDEVSASLESLRVDFAAAALDYCHGLDAASWLSACGGLELALERSSRAEQAGDQPRVESERVEPSLAAVVGLTLAYRALHLSPQLDVSAHVPLAPELNAPAPLGFRLAFGGSVQF